MIGPTATQATRRAIETMTATLPMYDRQDVDNARRSFVGRSADQQIRPADGRVMWDIDAYDFTRDTDALEQLGSGGR